MKKILIIILLLINKIAFADPFSYYGTKEIKIETKNFIVIHYHDWTNKTENARTEMILSDQNPFNSKNNYAYIKCINKKTGKIIFKTPSPALTKIIVSEDEKYILGISNLKIYNPYQLVLYTIDGSLLKKRVINSGEAKLDIKNYGIFKQKYASQYNYLNSQNRIYTYKNSVYIDFMSMNMPIKLGRAWDFLIKFSDNNHLSNNFSESTTNWINWFHRENPQFKFIYYKDSITHIEFKDPKEEIIRLPIKE